MISAVTAVCYVGAALYVEFTFSVVALVAWIYEVGTAVVVAGFLWFGLEGLELSAAVVALVVVIFARLYPRISELVRSWQSILSGIPSFEAYYRSISELERHTESPALLREAYVPITFEERLKLVNVGFQELYSDCLRSHRINTMTETEHTLNSG